MMMQELPMDKPQGQEEQRRKSECARAAVTACAPTARHDFRGRRAEPSSANFPRLTF